MSEEIYFEPCRLSAEESLCLTDRNETPEMGCIGHLRGDFGGGGKAFYSRWSDHLCADRNDELFKAVFGKLIDTLREKDNLLSCRTALYNNCISHPEWEDTALFVMCNFQALFSSAATSSPHTSMSPNCSAGRRLTPIPTAEPMVCGGTFSRTFR